MLTMRDLVVKYIPASPKIKVLDVGSQDVQGTYGNYSKWFSGHEYVGLDIEAGPNVDIVVKNPYSWNMSSFPGPYDLVISGQCLEHVEYPWKTMEEIARVMKPGALHFNIIPSTGPIHRFPIDTFRYNPDGAVALCKWAGLEVVEIQHRNDSIWNNVVLVARKP